MKKINIGIIGLGRLGSLYAGYVAHHIPGAQLVAVADSNEAAAASHSAALGVERHYRHYPDLLAQRDIDAVVVTTPTSTHKEVVVESAKCRKAIFCEKPLSLSLEECETMMKAVEDNGVFFHLGFMRRFDAGYTAAQKKIAEGAIGTPVVFKSSSRDPYRPSLEYADPKHSGGLIVDCGIHDFDLARWFMGEVAEVYSIGGTLVYPEMKDIGDIDNAIVSLTFVDGRMGVVDLSRSGIYGYDIRTEVLGTKGTLQIGYLRQTPMLVLTKEGVTHDTVPYFMERFEQAYIAQLQDFVGNFIHHKQPSVTGQDGIAALRISLAATASLKEGRPIIVGK
jgi:scyllo-inositol 2-dehydrogenase (NAD+)